MTAHYQAPGAITRHVMNPLVAFLTRHGLPLAGSAVLGVRGRTSGEVRSTPVNPLVLDGPPLPRGRARPHPVGAQTCGPPARRSCASVGAPRPSAPSSSPTPRGFPCCGRTCGPGRGRSGAFFEGVGADSTDEELTAIAPRHPVFVLADGPGSTGG